MNAVAKVWQCPCCKTVYAPHVSSCACKKTAVIKPQQPLTDNEKINQEAKLREEWALLWAKAVEQANKHPRPVVTYFKPKEPDPNFKIPKWEHRPFIEVHIAGVPGLGVYQANDTLIR